VQYNIVYFQEKMKFPEKIKTFCRKCGAHTEHTVRQDRKGKERTMNRGRRKYEEVKKGYGGSPRTPKKEVHKVGKRVVLLLKCATCGSKHQRRYDARTKKAVEVAS